MSSQFHPYLESVRAATLKRRAFYVSTDAKEKPPLDLMVKRVAEKKRQGQQEEEFAPVQVLEGIRALYLEHKHVLLVGRPGSGKSTALDQLLIEEVTRSLEDPTLPIPVLVQLKYDRPILKSIYKTLRGYRLRLSETELDDLLFDGKLLLLLDGVNEIPRHDLQQELQQFREDNLNVPMVFTTRDLAIGGALGIEKQLEMQPLTEAQMQAFIREFDPEQAEQMLRQLKDRLRELGQTPLLLWMLCDVFQRKGTIPENLGLVFREFTQHYERNLKEGMRIESDRDWWQPVLQQLAWVMMQGEKPTEFRVAIRYEEAVRAIGQFLDQKVPYAENFARKCLRDLQKHHLIQTGTNSEELEFRHQLIQEYYAAEALLSRLDRLENELLEREFLNFLKWTEPIALMMAFVDAMQAERVVKFALEVDWKLGARLAGEVSPNFQSTTVGLIVKKSLSEQLQLHLLAITRSNVVVPFIEQALDCADTNTCVTAVRALAKLEPQSAFGVLVKALNHRNQGARKLAASQLAEITDYSVSQSTISILITKLLDKSENCEIRLLCATALGKTKNQMAKCILQNIIFDPLEDVNVRLNIPHILAESNLSSALIHLEEALKDKDIGWGASISLVNIASDEAELILCNALFNGDTEARRNASFGLALINSEASCESLNRALQDELAIVLQDESLSAEQPYYLWRFRSSHADVIISLIGALTHLEYVSALPTLFTAYEFKDLHVRLNAIKAIARIQKKDAISFLSTILNNASHIIDTEQDENFDLMMTVTTASEALGETNSMEAVFILKKILLSNNSLIRVSAIAGLEKLQFKEIFPILLNSLCDPAEAVRERTAMAFDNLGETRIDANDHQIISALSKCLEDDNPVVRAHAAQALWRIGGQTASIDQFIEALEDILPMSRMSAARRLGETACKSDAISSALMKALDDEDIGVQTCAAEALGKIANPKLISQLYQRQLVNQQEYVSEAISAIQQNCKYYNYEIYQDHLEAQNVDRQPPQNHDRSPITQNFYAPVNNAIANVEGNLNTPPSK